MFTVIEVKSGYAVQNTKTYNIVFTSKVKTDAERVAANLNK